MKRSFAIVVPAVLAACAPAASSPSPPASTTPALPSLLATVSCPEIEDRLSSFASDGDIEDTYVWAKRCDARVVRDEVAVTLDAYAWRAVDQAFGPVTVREFVHVTIHVEATFRPEARYDGGRLHLTLLPTTGRRIAVEPVGILAPEPLNWLSLIAIELAPAAGESVEALAKTKLRDEIERALGEVLSKPLTLAYDTKHGTTSLGVASATGARRVRVAPHGTALLGPFPPSTGGRVSMRVEGGGEVLVRPVCRSHAERLVDADRRGDPVSLSEWRATAENGPLDLPAMQCPWMLALRTRSTVAIVDVQPLDVRPAPPALAHPDRWVAIDDIRVEQAPPGDDIFLFIGSDTTQMRVFPAREHDLPAITLLAADEELYLRARRHGKITIAKVHVPLTSVGPIDLSIAMTAFDGTPVARVRLRGRVQTTER